MATVTVTHLDADQFKIDVRGHRVLVDQVHKDSDEAGPTPTELFVASLAACVGHYAERFLRRHELSRDGLRVDCDWTMLAANPPRVGRIALTVTPPEGLPDHLQAGLREAIEHCTVHNSLRFPPQVTTEVAGVIEVADVEPQPVGGPVTG